MSTGSGIACGVVSDNVTAGDTLIVGVRDDGALDSLENAKAELSRLLPGVNVLFIEGATAMGAYRPDDQP